MKYRDLFNLKGKIAVVVGGGGLIGKELVSGLAEFGATIVLADSDIVTAIALASASRSHSLDVVPHRLDMTKEKSVQGFIKLLNNKYRRIDVWINAAYPRTKDWGKKFEDLTSPSWRKNIDMHLSGYFLCCKIAAEYMKAQKMGSIINFSSIYGMRGPDFSIYKGTSMTMPAAYSAIKGGIIGFTKYLASYYGRYNVRINCISPGGVYDAQPRLFIKRYTAKTPLNRMANPNDIVGGAIYLASDAARYVTGHNLVIDGGWSSV